SAVVGAPRGGLVEGWRSGPPMAGARRQGQGSERRLAFSRPQSRAAADPVCQREPLQCILHAGADPYPLIAMPQERLQVTELGRRPPGRRDAILSQQLEEQRSVAAVMLLSAGLDAIQHRNRLLRRVQIAANNPHLGLLRPERCGGGHRTVYAGRREADVVRTSFRTRERLPTEVNGRKGFGGAGYGDRTRVRGLGSLCTTIVLSPRATSPTGFARGTLASVGPTGDFHLTTASKRVSAQGPRHASAPSRAPSSPRDSAGAAARCSTAAR